MRPLTTAATAQLNIGHPRRMREGATRALRSFIRLVCVSTLLSACNSQVRESFTADDEAKSTVLGIPNVRFFADSEEAGSAAARLSQQLHQGFSYLALSGGGGDGAFGAGLLNGWTRTGTRPDFTVVSGVSTGALIAPFAFLGSAYDDTLREMYTAGYGITLVDTPNPVNAILGSGVFDSGRLLSLCRQFVTADVIAAVAREHRKGRRLLIITTNLDAQRPVIWNMGAIAASGAPGADDLFCEVMTASASIPGIFTPRMITAGSDGHLFQEMHVDGGIVSNVFVLPDDLLLRDRRLAINGRADVYVIMNGKLGPSFEVVNNQTADIVGRSVLTMIEVHSRAVLRTTSDFARRNGMGFHLAYIPTGVNDEASMKFDTEEMRRLFAYGYERGRSGTLWMPLSPASEPRTASATPMGAEVYADQH
jgi:Patatin-like phospholipase